MPPLTVQEEGLTKGTGTGQTIKQADTKQVRSSPHLKRVRCSSDMRVCDCRRKA